MLVQWCLKGVPALGGFDDVAAMNVLTNKGLQSNWVRSSAGVTIDVAWPNAHQILSDAALVAHVNQYSTVAGTTPYLSLTAGVIERDPSTRTPIRHSAWKTALEFATKAGTVDGYVFECWVTLPSNPAPELPGFAEEVRDLNLHRRFIPWHHQGEVAAKLVVPPRQIRRVVKFDRRLRRIPLSSTTAGVNPNFVPPERISNIRRLV